MGKRIERVTLGVVGVTMVALSTFSVQISCAIGAPKLEAPPTNQEVTENPGKVMLEIASSDDRNAGGFYVGRLADGTTLNMNVFFSMHDSCNTKASHGESGLCNSDGAFWYPDRFDGRVYAFHVVASVNHPSQFKFDYKWKGGATSTIVHPFGATGLPINDLWLGDLSPLCNGCGTYLSAPPVIDVRFDGLLMNDRSTISGTWINRATHQHEELTLRRLFVYRRIKASWPFYESGDSLKPRYADFTSIFPQLPYATARKQVVQDAATCMGDGSCDDEVTVVGFQGGLLTLRSAEFSSNASGTGGGDAAAEYTVYSVTGESAKGIKTDDLIDTKGDCGKRVGRMEWEQLSQLLRAMGATPLSQTASEAHPLGSATGLIPSKDIITIQYQGMNLNLLSAGEMFVSLPRKELGSCLRDQE